MEHIPHFTLQSLKDKLQNIFFFFEKKKDNETFLGQYKIKPEQTCGAEILLPWYSSFSSISSTISSTYASAH